MRGLNWSLQTILKLDRYYSNFVMDIVMCATWPIIQVYMIQHIDEEFYKQILLLESVLGIVMYWALTNTSLLEKARNKFWLVVGLGSAAMLFVNLYIFIYLGDVKFRFIFMTLSQAIFSCLWMNVMKDSYNQVFQKSKLTKRLNGNTMWNKLGKLVGGSLTLLFPMSIETAISLQCIAYVIMAFIEGMSVSRFKEMRLWDKKEEK